MGQQLVAAAVIDPVVFAADRHRDSRARGQVTQSTGDRRRRVHEPGELDTDTIVADAQDSMVAVLTRSRPAVPLLANVTV